MKKGFEFKIEILGVPYTVICDEKKLAEACEEAGLEVEDTQGLHVAHDLESRKIYISPLLSPTQWVQTFLHEVLHAIGNITGHLILSQSRSKAEAFVDAVATGFTTVLKNHRVRQIIDLILKGGDEDEKSTDDS